MVEVIYKETIEELDRYGALIIKEAIDKLLLEQEKLTLALPGGTSVSGILEELKYVKIDWKRVHVFLVDERLVNIDHKDSNYKLVSEILLDELSSSASISSSNIHPFILRDEVEDKGIILYQEELTGISNRYDVVLLSSGEDGHIGALYPNHDSVKDDSEYFIIMDNSPKPPKERMSISRELLLKSDTIILLFYNDHKRNSLSLFLKDGPGYEECPAKLIKEVKNPYVLTNVMMRFNTDHKGAR